MKFRQQEPEAARPGPDHPTGGLSGDACFLGLLLLPTTKLKGASK